MLSIIVLIFLILLTWYCFLKHEKSKLLSKIPGPASYPILGNALEVGQTPVVFLKNLIKWWYEADCKMFKFDILNKSYVVISEPSDIEAVLAGTVTLPKGELYKYLLPWLGYGLLTAEGSKWHKHRKIITPTFHFKILVDFLEVMIKNSNIFITKLKEKCESGEIFDIQEMLHYATLDIISETAMGTEINSMNNHDSSLVRAIEDMCHVVQQRFFNPFKSSNFFFKYTKDYKKHEKALATIKKNLLDVIQNRQKYIKNQLNTNNKDEDEFSKKRYAFLDTLLTATIDNRPLTNLEIYEEVSTFMFEGHDTTLSATSFSTFILSRHPNIQQKVYDEQKKIFGTDMQRNPTYQEVQDMKYLDLFIKECQRFYPSVPFIGRTTTTNLNLGDKTIPPNITILPLIFVMGYNEKYFPDPFLFNPERFSAENAIGRNPFQYIPFSVGPRNCIGQKFAVLEIKTIISNIVRNYEVLPPNVDCIRKNNYEKIDLNNIYDPILAAVLTLKSDNGIQIKLKSRK